MAAKSLGRLQVEIGSDATSLVRGMNHALGSVTSFARSALLQFVSLAAGALSVGSALTEMSGALRNIGVVEDVSTRIGSSVEGLSRIVSASGSSVEFLTKRFSEFNQVLIRPTSDAETVLTQLNLDAKELINLPIEDQVRSVAKAIEPLSQKSRTIAINTLFGGARSTESNEIVEMFSRGEDAVRRLIERSDEIGATISASSAVAVEKWSDAWGVIRQLWNSSIRNMAVFFVEILIEPLITIGDTLVLTFLNIKAAVADVRVLLDSIFAVVVNGLVPAFEFISDTVTLAFLNVKVSLLALVRDIERIQLFLGLKQFGSADTAINLRNSQIERDALVADIAGRKEGELFKEIFGFGFNVLASSSLAADAVKAQEDVLNFRGIRALLPNDVLAGGEGQLDFDKPPALEKEEELSKTVAIAFAQAGPKLADTFGRLSDGQIDQQKRSNELLQKIERKIGANAIGLAIVP